MNRIFKCDFINWKIELKRAIITIIAILILLGIVFFITAKVSAKWPLSKSKTCEILNLTGESCDEFWCDTVVECNYNNSMSACICIEIINETIYVNVTMNETNYIMNTTHLLWLFYNKTEIEEIYSNKTYTDEKLAELRNSMADRIDNITLPQQNPYNYSYKEQEPTPYWFIIAIVMIVGGIVVFMIYSKTYEKKFPKAKGIIRQIKIPEKEKQQQEKKPKLKLDPNQFYEKAEEE